MKGKIGKIVLACIILIVLVLSFIYMKDSVTIEPISKILDVAKDIEIDGKYLKVTYSSGNMIDEKISYNNTLEKNIKVVNYNNSIISYALELYDSSVSNEELYYKIEASNEKGGKYYTVVDNQKVKGDQALAYNLAIDPNSSIYLKVTFNSQNQGNPIELKGILNIKSNLTEKDIFIREVSNVDSELQLKIAELNGIGASGIYILSLDD